MGSNPDRKCNHWFCWNLFFFFTKIQATKSTICNSTLKLTSNSETSILEKLQSNHQKPWKLFKNSEKGRDFSSNKSKLFQNQHFIEFSCIFFNLNPNRRQLLLSIFNYFPIKLPSDFWIFFCSLISLCADDRRIELHDFSLVQF
jgi:hypothetical protein